MNFQCLSFRTFETGQWKKPVHSGCSICFYSDNLPPVSFNSVILIQAGEGLTGTQAPLLGFSPRCSLLCTSNRGALRPLVNAGVPRHSARPANCTLSRIDRTYAPTPPLQDSSVAPGNGDCNNLPRARTTHHRLFSCSALGL